MAVINLIQTCYEELDLIKAEIKAKKEAMGEPTKTTFSEVVCFLIKNYRAHALAKSIRNSNNEAIEPISDVDESSHIQTQNGRDIGIFTHGISQIPPMFPSDSIAQEV